MTDICIRDSGFGPWRDHDGFRRPHSPLTAVDVGFRDGTTERGYSGVFCWVWGPEKSNRDLLTFREISSEYAESPERNLRAIEESAKAFTVTFNPFARCHSSIDFYLVSEQLGRCFISDADRTAALANGRLWEAEVICQDDDILTLLAATRDNLLAETARRLRLKRNDD